jgi:hypothetical protein
VPPKLPGPPVPTVRISEPGRIPLHVVVHGPIDVGRSCDGVLLVDPELSRRHLRLTVDSGRLTVEDLESTNGTTLDGEPMLGPTAVAAGQVVRFGRCCLEVLRHELPAAPALLQERSNTAESGASLLTLAGAVAGERLPPWLRVEGTLTIVVSGVERPLPHRVATGEGRWLESLELHDGIVRRHAARAGGTVVASEDGHFVLAFARASRAVECVSEILWTLDVHRRSCPADALRVGVGVQSGEWRDDDELFGRPALVAAWIASQAGGAEVLVSSLVREILESGSGFVFGTTRYLRMREHGEPYAVHPIAWSAHHG